MKFLAIALCLVISGCASNRQTAVPFQVAMVPADCQNRQILLDWLEDQARQPQLKGETDREYSRRRNEIRRKIWDIRYHCQSV